MKRCTQSLSSDEGHQRNDAGNHERADRARSRYMDMPLLLAKLTLVRRSLAILAP